MQIASWLLVQRAVSEGEITPDQAKAEKNRVRLASGSAGQPPADFELLPMRLKDLIGLSTRLHARIMHLDQLMTDGSAPPAPPMDNAVAAQHSLLAQMFGAKE
jgi:regulator of CtrA degradation